MATVINLEEHIGKTVGTRQAGDPFVEYARLLRLSRPLRKPLPYPKGVFRFQTHEEANQWQLEHILKAVAKNDPSSPASSADLALPIPMRLLAFHQRQVVVPLERYTRRWKIRSDRHLQPTCLVDHVRAKRLGANLTMKELAQNLGIPYDSFKAYELHKSPPTGRNRLALVRYLGFDSEEGNFNVTE